MTTYTLQFSGHGSGQNTNKFTPFIGQLTIHYFVKEGDILDYDESIEIYHELVNNDLNRVNTRIKDTKATGAAITNYFIWDLQDPKFISGVLKVGENTPLVDIAGTTEDKPKLFSDLLRQAKDKLGANDTDSIIVYFNACRA